MPIPSPKKNEPQNKFISRCMGDKIMRKEYPDQKQRSGVCYTQWRRKGTKGVRGGDRGGTRNRPLRQAKLYSTKDKYVIEMEGEHYPIKVAPLKGFDDVTVCYSLSKDKTDMKVTMLYFDKTTWDRERIKLFLKRYGKQVLNYKGDVMEIIREIPQVKEYMNKQENRHLVKLESKIIQQLGQSFSMPFKFDFVAIKEGKFNGVFYPADELRKSYDSLGGTDLTIDHGKSVKDVVGKVESVRWNEAKKQVEGSAIVYDEDIAKKIHQGLIRGVSVEVFVDYTKTKNGLTAKNPEFVALSVVRVPACSDAQILR